MLPEEQQKKLMTSCVSKKTGKEPAKGETACYGLGIEKELSPETFLYEGGTLGYRAVYAFDPANQMTITIFINSSVDTDHVVDLLKKVYSLVKKSRV